MLDTANPLRGQGLDRVLRDRTLTGAGTVEVHSASGHTFTARGAQLALDGAEVINDANGKVREIDVTALSVRGTFTGAGEFGGDAVIRSGAAKILLDDRGAVTSVQATNLRGTGEVVHSTKLSLAPATPGNKPTKQQQLEHLANETASAETVQMFSRIGYCADTQHTPRRGVEAIIAT